MAKERAPPKEKGEAQRVYSAHGLLKQKFVRFMQSRGQCYTNELHFPFHFSFALCARSFALLLSYRLRKGYFFRVLALVEAQVYGSNLCVCIFSPSGAMSVNAKKKIALNLFKKKFYVCHEYESVA